MTTMHRLTVHRTHDNPDVNLDFTLPDDGNTAVEDALQYKSMLVYDLDNPVYTLLFEDADGGVHAIAVATHEIDYISIEPVPDLPAIPTEPPDA